MRIHPVDTESELGLLKNNCSSVSEDVFVLGSVVHVERSFKEVSTFLAHFVKTWYIA